MKGLIALPILIIFLLILTPSEINAIPNPAAVYCNDLGYIYKIVKTTQGETGMCTLPDKSECEEWNFFSGKCGKKYSYCAKQGYDLITKTDGKNSYSKEYAVCVDKLKEIGSATDLMRLSEKLTEIIETVAQESSIESEITGTPPSYFDWRNVNGYNWMTPVKNQGNCGSCWDFAVVGAVEGDANIEYNNPDLDKDLSEQDILSCSGAGSCSGGWSDFALDYIENTGVVDEPCFPYTATNQPCSNKCSDWQSKVFRIDRWGYVQYGSDGIKNDLIENGPIVTYLRMRGSFNSQGIYTCSESGPITHAVVLVGYNDTENYWIIKNSWGSTWNGDGYFKLAYGNCSVQHNFYVDTLPETTPPSPITDLSVISTSGTSAKLEWTASGDDGMIGNAKYYVIASSTSPITESNFDSAEKTKSYVTGSAGTKINDTVGNIFPETAYYFAIKAYDDYANPSDISNVVSGTTTTGIILFDDNIESDVDGWNRSWIRPFDISPGEDDPVLWHITEHRSSSPTYSWYYGIEGQWNYNTGLANNGSLITPIIDIKNYSDIYLIVKYSTDLEPWVHERWQDDFRGSIIIDGQPGGGMGGMFFDNRSTKNEFIKRMFNLGNWGETLRVSFNFESMDELYNDYEGIYLDDIKIIADGHKPVANSDGPYVNNSGYSITFDGSGSYDLDGDTLTYSWYFGDSSYGYEKIVTHTYSSPGIYAVSLLVNDGSSQSEYRYTTASVLWASCTDSDGGIYPKVKGYVSGYQNGIPYTYYDYCTGGSTVFERPLYEYYCDGTTPKSIRKDCYGYGTYWFCKTDYAPDGSSTGSYCVYSHSSGGGGGGGGCTGAECKKMMWSITDFDLISFAVTVIAILVIFGISKLIAKKDRLN